MHGIVTGIEDRQLLYTMLTRGRIENHVHVIAETVPDIDEPALPGLVEQLTATEALEAVLARDGAAVSATTTAAHATEPATQLHDAVRRYADALGRAAHAVLRAGADDILEAAEGGPLPWLPGVPADLANHETWRDYLSARAQHIITLATQVREYSQLPAALERVSGLLPDRTRDAFAYGRRLQHRIDECYPASVRHWETHVIEVVGRHDEQTLDLARYLDGLHRGGHNPAQLLARAARRGPLPDDHATEALAYRVQRLVTRSRGVAAPMLGREPTRQRPGIGL